ncbi:unnamed protein product, partial [Hermetia illucens]
FIEKEEEKKDGIERQLEDSDKALSQLILLGDELVTNIKIANEKREVMRRNYEALKREELLGDLENESMEAMAKFEEITAKWTELEAIKEPVGLNEGLALQKKRIEELMKEKDDAIRKCQEELQRVDRKYYDDLERQSADIYCLVERIDNQMENMRKAFKSHIELVQETIENERQNLALTAARKWEELYTMRAENERMKLDKEKEKAAFYAAELARISLEHEELTRETRIRLEKDAEALQLELRSVKHNVLLNSEKLDYNYQVLQKADDENAITVSQQKRRLAKLNEAVLGLKKKIRETKSNSQLEVRKLTTEVTHLHSCIVDLESKTENFSILEDKKYQAVWEVNLNEATGLLNKILDIDRILHEQQLGLPWTKPDMPVFKLKDFIIMKEGLDSKHFDLKVNRSRTITRSESAKEKDRRTDEQKLAHSRLMRNILKKIADRGGFLLEDKLLTILQPYTEDQQSLVKVDNIFNALGVSKIEDISALIHYFLPYAWCPNCSTGLSPAAISRLHQVELEQFQTKDIDSVIYDELSEKATLKDTEGSGKSEKSHQSTEEESSEIVTKDEENPMDDLMKEFAKKEVLDRKRSVQFEEKVVVEEETTCVNHYLVIEPAFVLTALREFAEKHLCQIALPGITKSKTSGSERSSRRRNLNRNISRTDIETFWHQFNNIFPQSKLKLWQNLEHGLNHYLKVLKDRVTLDAECEFLRKQNAELKHLLQQYLPPDKCIC